MCRPQRRPMRRSAGPLDDRSRAGRATGTILATAPANWTGTFRISPDRVTTPQAATRTPHRPADAVSAVCRSPGRRGMGPDPSPASSGRSPGPPRNRRRHPPRQRGDGDPARASDGRPRAGRPLVPTVPWRVAVAGGRDAHPLRGSPRGRSRGRGTAAWGRGGGCKPPPRATRITARRVGCRIGTGRGPGRGRPVGGHRGHRRGQQAHEPAMPSPASAMGRSPGRTTQSALGHRGHHGHRSHRGHRHEPAGT